MGTYNRRTFLRGSAMAAAAATVDCLLPTLVTGSSNTARPRGVDHPFFARAKNQPEVIAHRGGDRQWPGETMYAYKRAMAIGVDVIEMDVYLTKDDELVLMHDAGVGRTTGGKGHVNDLTLEQLQGLNAGHNWQEDGGTNFPFRGKDLPSEVLKDLRVPSLKEVFAAFPGARMNVEMKPAKRSPAAALSKLIGDTGMGHRVLVASFWPPYINEFRRLSPEVATSASISLKDLNKFIAGKHPSAGGPSGPAAVQVPYKLITKKFVARAKSLNLKLHAWTVNDLPAMSHMKTLGVDGIITDYPGPLLTLLGRQLGASRFAP